MLSSPPPSTLALGHAEGNSAVTYGLNKETSVLTQCCGEKYSRHSVDLYFYLFAISLKTTAFFYTAEVSSSSKEAVTLSSQYLPLLKLRLPGKKCSPLISLL